MTTNIDDIHQQILIIKNQLNELAHDLTNAHDLDPDFTLIEIAKTLSCLLNISSRIYRLRPDLVPEHLKACDWHQYKPQ